MAVVLEQVSRVVGRESHLAQVSLELAPGSLTVLLGPTLAGKTSLLRVLAGLDRPTMGRLLVDGRDVTGVPVQRRSVAMVYQQFINYPNLTVFENIASPLRAQRVAGPELERRVREAAALLKLEPMLARLPQELSGGQQQRTAIARAIVKGADLLLLDEPLANLDYKLREELRTELPRLFAESGATLVYATTEPTEALLLGGSCATLTEGRVTQFGPTVEVYRRPNSVETAQIFSDPPINLVPVDKVGAALLLPDGGRVPLADGVAGLRDGPYRLGVRPNHLALVRPNQCAVAIIGTVAVAELTGSESFIHLDYGPARWVVHAAGIHKPTLDEPVAVWLDPARLYLFAPDGALAGAGAAIGLGAA